MTDTNQTAGKQPSGERPRFLAHHFSSPAQQFESGKLGMWIFLVTEILFFGGLVLAYAVYRSDPEKAEVYGNRALTLSEKTELKKEYAESYMIIGTSYWVRGNYDEALKYYTKSLKVCEENDDKKGAASCYNNIGFIYRNRGAYEQALQYHLRALKTKEELGDKFGIARCYNNIGIIYDERGDYDKAMDYYNEALGIFEELEDKQGIAFSYNNLGVVYEARDDYDRALQYHRESLKIKEELGDKKGTADSYINIGGVHEKRDEYSVALDYYLKALKLLEDIDDKRESADACISIGRVHTQLGHFDAALKYLQEGLRIARDIGALYWEMDSYKELANLYENRADFEQALRYYKLYSDLRESVFDEESDRAIADLMVKYETEKKEKESEIYRLKNVELESLIVERKQAEERLEKLLAEKEILLDEINHRVKNNLQVIISLLSLQSAQVDNEDVRRILGESIDRIRTMSLIHDKLYKADDLTRIDLGVYIRDLTEELFSSYSNLLSDVNLAIDVEEVPLPVSKAIPFGLIINELLNNSFKYAFPDGMRGEILVELKLDGTDKMTLTFSDNGIGFPTDFNIEKTETLGLQIVDALIRQLDGSLEIAKTGGAKYTIKSPIE